MIVLIAKYYVKPGNVPKVLSALERIKPLVRDGEPGCKFYQVSHSTENENLIVLYEHYIDQAALQHHRETPHFKSIIEGIVVPLLEKRDREVYELVIL